MYICTVQIQLSDIQITDKSRQPTFFFYVSRRIKYEKKFSQPGGNGRVGIAWLSVESQLCCRPDESSETLLMSCALQVLLALIFCFIVSVYFLFTLNEILECFKTSVATYIAFSRSDVLFYKYFRRTSRHSFDLFGYLTYLRFHERSNKRTHIYTVELWTSTISCVEQIEN